MDADTDNTDNIEIDIMTHFIVSRDNGKSFFKLGILPFRTQHYLGLGLIAARKVCVSLASIWRDSKRWSGQTERFTDILAMTIAHELCHFAAADENIDKDIHHWAFERMGL